MSYAEMNINSAGKFLRIESGQPHDIRLLSETPVAKLQHGFGKDAFNCTGPDKACLKCMDGDEARQRFAANIFDHAFKKVMIFEFGSSIAKQFKAIDQALKEEQKSICDIDLRIDASGSNKSKKYTVTPRMSAKPLPPDLKLHSLVEDISF